MSAADGYEQHPLLHKHVRDIASRAEGELTAVTRQLHTDGRTVRIAHIRPENGVELTTHADNIEPAVGEHPHIHDPPILDVSG
ncbi:hypothetical protein [Streptomyces sp. AB3(2024)]|uniref:hypothetical protein n=1 Tax=Streptomyces sp. AB3(2024) TaxID=3317321 RepID=UPI0035A2BFD5